MTEALLISEIQKSKALEDAKGLLKRGSFEDALRKIGECGEEVSESKDALYLKAVCFRYMEQTDQALDTLSQLLNMAPTFSKGFQERGHCFKYMGENNSAIQAYEKAVSLNRMLHSSWQNLFDLYPAENHHEKKAARATVDYLASLPKQLLSANSLLFDGEITKAELLTREFLVAQPHHLEALRTLAQIASKRNHQEEALFIIESAVAIDCRNIGVQYDLAELLLNSQRFNQALTVASQLFALQSSNPSFELLYANCLTAIGKTEEAIVLYKSVLQKLPNSAAVKIALANTLKTIGEPNQAIVHYKKACQLKDAAGEAYWSLANLKTYRFCEAEIAEMELLLDSREQSDEQKMYLHFGLGKAYEDKELFEEAFHNFELGNNLKARSLKFNFDAYLRNINKQTDQFTGVSTSSHEGGHPTRDPIFIVGLPRSGSTLLEQILASHPDVDGTLELPNIMFIARSLTSRSKEKNLVAELQHLSNSDCYELGEQYLEQVKIHRGTASRFVDKMPNNYQYIGLIKRILPNAKILDARRNPLDCGFSIYKQLFAQGQEFSYNLENIGKIYTAYTRIMAFWSSLFPENILTVQYEDILQDIETQVRHILDFLDLPYSPNCLEFHETTRPVRTASSEQVRRPLNTNGLDVWQNYEKFLQPLKWSLEKSVS